jgi:hypothetical protein
MKKTLILVWFSIMTISLGAQSISESMYHYKDVYNPLFSSDKSVLYLDLIRNYPMSGGDTSHVFNIELKKQEVEEQGFTLGYAVIGGYGIASTYDIKRREGSIVLNKLEFDEFYSCIREVHSYVSKYEKYGASDNDIVATCGASSLVMGGEYTSRGGDSVRYYFRLGGTGTYSMTESQFIDVVQMLKRMKLYWDKNQ